MRKEQITKMKKAIAISLNSYRLKDQSIEEQKIEFENFLRMGLEKETISEQEYNELIKYLNKSVSEIKQNSCTRKTSKQIENQRNDFQTRVAVNGEKDFIEEFRKRVIEVIPRIYSKKEEKQMVDKMLVEAKQKCDSERFSEQIGPREDPKKEFQRRIRRIKKKDFLDEDDKESKISVLEIRTKGAKTEVIEKNEREISSSVVFKDTNSKKDENSRKLDVINVELKRENEKSRIERKSKAYNGNMINLKSEKQKSEGEER